MAILNRVDWSNFIPCNDEYVVPLYVRPTFKDMVTLELGAVLPNLASSPSDYRRTPGSIYYNSVDQQLYYRDASSWKALGVSGAFPLNATSGASTDEIITSLISPDVDITWSQLADGTSRMYDGAGNFESQLGYDAVLNRWFMENTIGSRNGTLSLATLLASTSVSTPALTTTTIDAPGAGISFSSKDLTTIGAITTAGTVTVGGSLAVTGTTTLTGALSAGNITASGTLGVTGVTTLTGALNGGSATLSGTLAVTGATTLTGNLTAGNIFPGLVRGPLEQTFGTNPLGYRPAGFLYKLNAVFGSTAAGGTQTVFTFTLPTGTLAAYGDGIRIFVAGRIGNSANAKSLRFTFNGTNYDSNAFTTGVARSIVFIATLTRATSNLLYNLTYQYFEAEAINKGNYGELAASLNFDTNGNVVTLSSLTGTTVNDIIIRHAYAEII